VNAGHFGFLALRGNLKPVRVGVVFGDVFSSQVFPATSMALLGAGIVVAAALACLTAGRRQVHLVVALALAAPVALLLATLAGHPALLIRYAGVSVPFMLVALAVAAVMLPRPATAAVVIGVLALSLRNLRVASQPTDQYQNFPGKLTYLAHHYRPGDVVVELGGRLENFDLDYYFPRLLPRVHVFELPPAPPHVVLSMAPVCAHKTTWFVNTYFPVTPTPHPSGDVVTAHRVFIDIRWLHVARFQPSPAAAALHHSPKPRVPVAGGA
jgi:hypothetical protein